MFMIAVYSKTNAQISFKAEYFGTSSYRMMEGDTDEKIGNSKGSALVYQGGINVPLSMTMDENNHPTMWSISAGCAYAKLDNKNFTEPLVVDEILNLGLNLSYMRPLNNKWSVMAILGGGIYMPGTKFSRIKAKNILGNVGAIFIYHLKVNLELGGGIALNNSFGYPMAFPAFYFNWAIEGRYVVKISMMEGFEMLAGYNVDKKLSLNIVAGMSGQMALLEEDGKDKIFTHQYIVTGFRPEIKIGKHLSVSLTAGIHAFRPAEITSRSLKSIFQDKGYYFQISPYVSAGLQIGF